MIGVFWCRFVLVCLGKVVAEPILRYLAVHGSRPPARRQLSENQGGHNLTRHAIIFHTKNFASQLELFLVNSWPRCVNIEM